MVKQTQKQTRSAGGGGFTGFAAFANHTSVASAAISTNAKQKQKQKQTQTQSTKSKQTSTSSSLIPSPIYTGGNTILIQIFKRLSKKDGITKTRALQELSQLYSSSSNGNGNTGTCTGTTRNITKKELLTAASHFLFLLSHKIFHEDDYAVNGSVRIAAMTVLQHMISYIPKATYSLLRHDAGSGNGIGNSGGLGNAGGMEMGDGVGSVGNVLGWIYTLQCSPMTEVSKTATSAWGDICKLLEQQYEKERDKDKDKDKGDDKDGNGDNKNGGVKTMIQSSILHHVQSILANSARPHNLHEALSVLSSSSSSKSKKEHGGTGGKKLKKIGLENMNGDDALQKERMEEQYMRIILSCLHGTARFFQEYPEQKENENGGMRYIHMDVFLSLQPPTVLWRHMHNQQRSSFRRATYALIANVAQYAPSLLFGATPSKDTNAERGGSGGGSGSGSMSTNILQQLSSERDGANIAPLLEMTIVYIASYKRYTHTPIWNEDGNGNGNGNGNGSDAAANANVNAKKHAMNAAQVTKVIAKMIQRGCYASPASSWTPMMLPFLASLPAQSTALALQWNILSCMWNVKHKVGGNGGGGGGGAEAVMIVTAVAECALYILLQKRARMTEDQDDNDGENGMEKEKERERERDLAMNVAQTFLACVTYYLTQGSVAALASSSASASTPQMQLLHTLIRDLNKLHHSTRKSHVKETSRYCMFDHVQSWFWEEGMMDVLSDCNDNGDDDDSEGGSGNDNGNGNGNGSQYANARLTMLVDGMREASNDKFKDKDNKTHQMTSMYHSLRHHVWNRIVPVCGKTMTMSIPSLEVLRLLLSLFQFCGMEFMFDDHEDDEDGDEEVSVSMSMGTFCKEYVVGWICAGPSLGEGLPSPSQSQRSIGTFRKWVSAAFELLFLIFQEAGCDKSTNMPGMMWTYLLQQMNGGSGDGVGTDGDSDSDSEALNSNVKTLTEGISTMLSLASSRDGYGDGYTYDEMVELLHCDELDHVAIQVASMSEKVFMDHHATTSGFGGLEQDDSDSEADLDHDHEVQRYQQQQKLASAFLHLCAGVRDSSLSSSPSTVLVRPHVIESWTKMILSNSQALHTRGGIAVLHDKHLLMDVILSIAGVHPFLVGRETILDLIVLAWKEGGPTWQRAVDEFVSTDESLCNDLAIQCSAILKRDVKNGCRLECGYDNESKLESTACTGNVNVDDAAFLWSERAWRLTELCAKGLSPSSCADTPPLHLVGLGDRKLWAAAAGERRGSDMRQFLHLCLMQLMEKLSSWDKRQAFLCWTNDNDENSFSSDFSLVAHMFMTLVVVDDENHMTQECNELLILLGGLDKTEGRIASYIVPMIDLVAGAMKDVEDSYCVIQNGIIVLDWFLGLSLSKFVPISQNSDRSDDDVNQSEVKEGDELWYVLDGTKVDSGRIKATIVKVHTDDFPNLYFTIQYQNEANESVTKQTIASRLKSKELAPADSPEQPTFSTNQDRKFIQKLEDEMTQKIIKPFIQHPAEEMRDIVCEVVNSVVSHCGLQGKGGIGTTRLDVIQVVSQLEQDVLARLSGEKIDATCVAPMLRRLSIALGYGTLTSVSSFNCDILKFNGQSIINSMRALLDMDGSINYFRGSNGSPLRIAIFMWLTMTAKTMMQEENATTIWEIFDVLASAAVDEDASTSTSPSSMLMMTKACVEINQVSSLVSDSVKSAFIASKQSFTSNLLAMFILCNDSKDLDHQVDDEMLLRGEHPQIPGHYLSFKTLVMNELQNDPSAILHAARMQAEGLVQCLESPIKRWFAFHILLACAQSGHMLYTEDEVTLGEGTAELLNSWKGGLEEEEAMEIEEDVIVAAQWLPRTLMSQIEHWEAISDDEEGGGDENIYVSHLLRWILCLEYLDAAGKADMRHRAHITSYIDKTGAVQEMFQIVMSFAKLKKQEPQALFQCISVSSNEAFSIEKLSTFATFRTIESMPTLCKSWWNDDCPRALQSEMNRFVEGMVAPETLRRELDRINVASNLGEMTVRGSCMSREVVATYIQDECKLSVVIRIPPTFPFRNVEVDCQKTLGVSENRWRHWALQIMRMLNGQDGSILDALLLWKQNVDKEFDGVEPCPVCYSVLCVKTHAMPNLECKTCHNRFHSSCLYKWFHSSGKHQCVLCQQPWSGTKVA